MGDIIMPKMGDAMTEGKVVRWYKKAGDPVKKGEPVLEIETDKVNLDLEAEEDGVLDQVAVEEGAMAPVGSTLATVRAAGAAASPAAKKTEAPKKEETPKPASAEAPKEDAKPAPASEAEAKPAPKAATAAPKPADAPRAEGGRVRSSPLARRMAREMGVDIAGLSGSGPGGRVVAADISAASTAAPRQGASQGPAAARAPMPARGAKLEQREIPLTAMRRTIAKRLAESIGPIPHFYLTVDLDVTNLLQLRLQLNEIEGAKVSVNDFIIRAAALALSAHPNVNASFGAEAITQHGEVHVGVAVATPEGLITPVIRDAMSKSVLQISDEVRALAEKARNRKLKPDEYQGATFTISNLGMFGVEEFTAIINPPNSAILAVGAASQQPVVVGGQIVIRDRMKVTMSCDHRVIDGAAGAQYLQTLRQYIEQPLRLVM